MAGKTHPRRARSRREKVPPPLLIVGAVLLVAGAYGLLRPGASAPAEPALPQSVSATPDRVPQSRSALGESARLAQEEPAESSVEHSQEPSRKKRNNGSETTVTFGPDRLGVPLEDYPFNYRHEHFYGPVSEGGLSEWMREMRDILEENNLEWPRSTLETDDRIVEANLRRLEMTAMRLIPTNPVGAVELMQTYLEREETKFTARAWMNRLRASEAEGGGKADPRVYAETLANLPERYFNQVIQHGIAPGKGGKLAQITLEQSLTKPPMIKLPALAQILETSHLPTWIRQNAASELANELDLPLYTAGTLLEDTDYEDRLFEKLDMLSKQ